MELNKANYEMVCGMEIHVQLNTKTKIFSSDSTSFGAPANQHISTVSLALPGALPKLNKEVIQKAIKMGLALNCHINQYNYFDRKNYFYADLPKGFQTSQDSIPICGKGYLEIKKADGTLKIIGITRIHMEEDAGKSIHDQDPNFTFVDLNRAGVPLIEIVTEPDIRSEEEASLVLVEIRKLAKYLDLSDGNMEEGSIRCDANISIRESGSQVLNTRCEIKNLNSVRFLRKALTYEFKRQVLAYQNQEEIVQSTLTFDPLTETTSAIRSKEEANDYRYFPEPDLAPIQISDETLAQIRSEMPVLPNQLMLQWQELYQLSEKDLQILIDEPSYYTLFNQLYEEAIPAKTIVNWLNGAVKAYTNEHLITNLDLNPKAFAYLIQLVAANKITQQNAHQLVLPILFKQKNSDIANFINENNLLIDSNEEEIQAMIQEVLANFEPQVQAYKNGKKGLLGLFVGEIMKLSKGKASPQIVNKLIIKELNK